MPSSNWTKKIPFLLLAQDCTTETNGFLSMTRSNRFYRATVRIDGEEDRTYGTIHQYAYQTAMNVLNRFPERIQDMERTRVLDIVEQFYGRSPDGLQPRNPPDTPVAIVHQIYGMFRDGKPMPFLFQNSQRRWREVAKQMGAQYHLWSADEVDALVKKHFPQFWAMYKKVPFPVMRVDIGRICILYHYGGMYSDLDVFPNCDSFAQVPLAVQKTYTTGYKTVKGKCHSMKKKHPVYYKLNSIDIEVLIASQYNPVLERWLLCIRDALAVRKYKKRSVWDTRRIRYIHHTTGPACLKRWLRLPTNKAVVRSLKYIPSNNFSHARELTSMEKSNFDVLSFLSNSYFGHKPYKHPVGDGEGPLPVLDGSQPSMLLCRRFRGKRKPLQQDVRSQCMVVQDVSEESSGPDVSAQGIGSQPSTKHPHDTAASQNSLRWASGMLVSVNSSNAASSRDTLPTTSQGTHIIDNGTLLCFESRRRETRCRDDEIHIENKSRDQGTQTEMDEEATQLEEHVVQLRAHVKRTRFNQATVIFLEDMPVNLRAFVKP